MNDSETCFPGARASKYAHETRAGLTTGFGMGPGVSLQPWPSFKLINSILYIKFTFFSIFDVTNFFYFVVNATTIANEIEPKLKTFK